MPQPAQQWSDADTALLEAIYELQCTSRMNATYYELRLSKVQAYSFWMEVIVAAAASGSGLASVVAKMTGMAGTAAQEIWPIIAICAAIAAVVRPIYAPGRRIEAFTRQHQGYVANFFGLQKLAFAIRQEGRILDEHRRRYDSYFDRHIQLSTENKAQDEAAPNNKCRRLAEERTRGQLPPERFWWPSPSEPASPPQQPLRAAE